MAEKKTVITIDPSLEYSRRLHYNEKHSGWQIFKSIYWSIYVFIMGVILYAVPMATSQFFGWALMLFALFFIVYGFSTSLHLKLMKRYA
ncbi:MAG: hypothetical protein M1128_02780 [Candidatus Marsarchaeota archaeon]|nr:hypothetical protein [Candidatus Marsarchaeota archaeon]